MKKQINTVPAIKDAFDWKAEYEAAEDAGEAPDIADFVAASADLPATVARASTTRRQHHFTRYLQV